MGLWFHSTTYKFVLLFFLKGKKKKALKTTPSQNLILLLELWNPLANLKLHHANKVITFVDIKMHICIYSLLEGER